MKLKSYASLCLTSCPVVFIDSNDEFWLWPRLGVKKINHDKVAFRENAIYLVVSWFLHLYGHRVVLTDSMYSTGSSFSFYWCPARSLTSYGNVSFICFFRSIFLYELISPGLFLNDLKVNGPVHVLLVGISPLSYRKIPKISPSMYKPPKLVTQKTLL